MRTIKILALLLCAVTLSAQTSKPSTKAPDLAEVAPPAKPPKTVQPKESLASLKLQLALEKQKNAQMQALALQQAAMQSIEPRMYPLRAEFQDQTKKAADQEIVVRKENGFGPDIQLDQNLTSPTFGQWIKNNPQPGKK